jgi:hypothetical protein
MAISTPVQAMTSLETKLAPAEAEDDIRSQTLQGNTGEADGEKHESHKEGDAEAQHPSTTGLVLIAAGLCLSVFLVSLVSTSSCLSSRRLVPQ